MAKISIIFLLLFSMYRMHVFCAGDSDGDNEEGEKVLQIFMHASR